LARFANLEGRTAPRMRAVKNHIRRS